MQADILLRATRLALVMLMVAGLAQPAAISIFSTGVDAGGSVLPDGTVGDPHYTLVSVPGGTSAIRILTSLSGFPIPPWVADNSTSAWIGPDTTDAEGPVGDYLYRTTFDLTGLIAATASLSGRWSSDNAGLDIILNGVSTGINSPSLTSFETFTPFTINSGFVSGVNELIFRVNNAGGPTGLRVEIAGTADPSAVPEPASFVLVGLGLTAAHVVRRARQRAA